MWRSKRHLRMEPLLPLMQTCDAYAPLHFRPPCLPGGRNSASLLPRSICLLCWSKPKWGREGGRIGKLQSQRDCAKQRKKLLPCRGRILREGEWGKASIYLIRLSQSSKFNVACDRFYDHRSYVHKAEKNWAKGLKEARCKTIEKYDQFSPTFSEWLIHYKRLANL